MSFLRLGLILWCLLLGAAGFGQVSEARDWVIKSRFEQAYDRFKEGFGFPSLPPSKGYVLIGIQYAGFCEIYLIGPDGEDEKKLAGILSEWRTRQGMPGEAYYSDEAEGSVAFCNLSFAKRFASQVESNVGVADLAASLGPDTRIGWLIPHYATPEGVSDGIRGERSSIYDLSKAPPRAVTAGVVIGGWSIASVLLFAAYVPFVMAVALIVAGRVARKESIPIERRRILYPKIIMGSLIGSIATHIPFVMYFLISGNGREVSDAWFGTRPASLMLPLLLVSMVVPILILPRIQPMERRLFGRQPDDPEPISTPSEKKPFDLVAFLRENWLRILGVALYIIAITLPPKMEVARVLRLAGFVLFLSPWSFTRKINKEVDSLQPADPETQAMADLMAREMGLQKKLSVRVMKDSVGSGIHAGVFGEQIMVSPAFITDLTPDEQQFIFAHEIAHVVHKHSNTRYMVLMMLPVVVFLLAPFTYRVFGGVLPSWAIAAMFGFLICWMGASWFIGGRHARNREFLADRVALEATGNLDAAVSAFTKMKFGSAMPYAHDNDWQLSHPAMWRRIEALRKLERSAPDTL